MNKQWLCVLRSFLLSGVWGLISLFAVNLSAVYTDISLGFGWVSGGVATFLGTPGVVCLLLLNALFSSV